MSNMMASPQHRPGEHCDQNGVHGGRCSAWNRTGADTARLHRQARAQDKAALRRELKAGAR